jgi:hypothetical protein
MSRNSIAEVDLQEERSDQAMDEDKEKIDEVVLALLHLTSFAEHGIVRAWKGHDWDALDRLHKKGMISDPKSKAKSVVLSESGAERAKELFNHYFGKTG